MQDERTLGGLGTNLHAGYCLPLVRTPVPARFIILFPGLHILAGYGSSPADARCNTKPEGPGKQQNNSHGVVQKGMQRSEV